MVSALWAQTDSFGYRASTTSGNDSDFQSIRTNGGGLTPVGEAANLFDDGYVEIDLPVPFVFYGKSYPKVRMSTNGYLALADPQTDQGNVYENPSVIPTPHDGGAIIHAFHDDLIVGQTDSMFFKYEPLGLPGFSFRPNVGVAIFEWVGPVDYASELTNVSFQALLFDDGSIQINFPSTNNDVAAFTASIGIQNEEGTIGLDFLSETSVLSPAPITRVSYNILPPRVLVTSKNLFGPGSLYDLIPTAPNPAHIEFSPEVFTGGEANILPLFNEVGNSRFLNNFQHGKVLTINAAPVGGVTLTAAGSGMTNATLIQHKVTSRLHLQALTLTGGNNTTTSDTMGFGGAIANFNGASLTLLDCTIHGNSASTAGGAVVNAGASFLRMTNCTITENDALFGGGVFVRETFSTQLVHCTVTNNTGAGGGAFCDGAGLTIENCLFSNPEATGGSDLNANTGSILTLRRSNFIRNNQGFFSTQLTPSSIIGTVTNPIEPRLVGDGKAGSGLADNGGPTPTLVPQPGSPVINRASNNGRDQRGRRRVGSADLGAVEAEWGDTLTAFDPFGFPVYDFMKVSENLTFSPAALASGSNIPLINDNNPSTFSNISNGSVNWNITFTTELKQRPLRLRGIRYSDDSLSPDLVTIYGSNDGINFTNLGSGDFDDIAGLGEKTLFLRSSGASEPGLLSQEYRQFRVQFSSSRGSFGGTFLSEFEILVAAPATEGVYNLRSSSLGNFFFLDVDVAPGVTYDLFTSPDLSTPFEFKSSFTATINPGVFGATVIVGPVTPERGFFEVRRR